MHHPHLYFFSYNLCRELGLTDCECLFIVVQGQPGQTVVYTQDTSYRRRGYDGTDMAMGMVAGAALGTMMWGPLLWW